MKVKGTSKNYIRRCLEASQDVRLSEGHTKSVYVHNYTDKPNTIKLPKFGNYRSLDEVKEDLRKTIEEKYPKSAFPFREICDEIILWQRDETDPEYTCKLKIVKA